MEEKQENKIEYLRLDDIIPNRFQPREEFDEEGLEELAKSIEEHGVIQPIIVRPIGDKYELIAGERRTKASAIAGLTTIPAIVRNMDDKESAKVSLLENLQRRNLSAIEEARTYKRILELDNITQENLAKTMGRSQPMIANKLRLLSLPEEVQDALMKNQISERHARSLLTLSSKEEQLNFLERIEKERLTVRELDNLIKEYKNNREIKKENEPIERNDMNNNRFNFGGMGLNDYQSRINNNMFNNIPNNFNNMENVSNSNSFQNQIQPENYSYNQNNSVDDNYYNEINQVPNSQTNEPYYDNNFQANYQTDNNMFVSNIKEYNMPQTENKFLPNLDNFNQDNNYYDNQNENQSNMVNYDNFNQQPQNSEIYNYQQPTNDQNNNYNMPSNNYSNSFVNPISNQNGVNQSYNNDIPSNTPIYNDSFAYQDNQEKPNNGSLFEQPLNLVDVPNNDKGVEDNNQVNEENFDESRFDNPLDDEYEDILFAKEVPIQKEVQNDTILPDNKENNQTDIEIIGEETEDSKDKNSYIDINPEITINNLNDAILEIKMATDKIKANHIDIQTEEIDFDDVYQITIKINKQ